MIGDKERASDRTGEIRASDRTDQEASDGEEEEMTGSKRSAPDSADPDIQVWTSDYRTSLSRTEGPPSPIQDIHVMVWTSDYGTSLSRTEGPPSPIQDIHVMVWTSD